MPADAPEFLKKAFGAIETYKLVIPTDASATSWGWTTSWFVPHWSRGKTRDIRQ
jgi:hypothetical protein